MRRRFLAAFLAMVGMLTFAGCAGAGETASLSIADTTTTVSASGLRTTVITTTTTAATTSAATTTTAAPTTTTTTLATTTTADTTTTTAAPTTTTSAVSTTTSTVLPDSTTTTTVLDKTDPESSDAPVEETMPTLSEEQAAAWFADAVFVGNSRTQGLLLYTELEADMIAERGLNVITAFHNDATTLQNGKKGSVLDALAQKTYGKIYVKFGMNEFSWMSTADFLDYYAKLIDSMREIQPQAIIYVQSILPITQSRSVANASSGSAQTQARIDVFNVELQRLCVEKGVTYLAVEQAVKTANGYLDPAYAAQDGYHLNRNGCLRWLDYLKQAVNPQEMGGN